MPDVIDNAQAQEAMIRAWELRAHAHRRPKQLAHLVSDLGVVYCLEGGERIPLERLKAMPDAAYCVEGQREIDEGDKGYERHGSKVERPGRESRRKEFSENRFYARTNQYVEGGRYSDCQSEPLE